MTFSSALSLEHIQNISQVDIAFWFYADHHCSRLDGCCIICLIENIFSGNIIYDTNYDIWHSSAPLTAHPHPPGTHYHMVLMSYQTIAWCLHQVSIPYIFNYDLECTQIILWIFCIIYLYWSLLRGRKARLLEANTYIDNMKLLLCEIHHHINAYYTASPVFLTGVKHRCGLDNVPVPYHLLFLAPRAASIYGRIGIDQQISSTGTQSTSDLYWLELKCKSQEWYNLLLTRGKMPRVADLWLSNDTDKHNSTYHHIPRGFMQQAMSHIIDLGPLPSGLSYFPVLRWGPNHIWFHPFFCVEYYSYDCMQSSIGAINSW